MLKYLECYFLNLGQVAEGKISINWVNFAFAVAFTLIGFGLGRL